MINVIICDDNKEITALIKKELIKTLFSKKIEYKIYVFNSYNDDFKKVISSSIQNKFYILDIEIGNNSGIEISKEIRTTDWDSAILLLTAHYELEHLANHSKILLLDFISKFDLYQEKIKENIDIYINKILKNDKLSFKYLGSLISLRYRDIIYIFYDKTLRKSVVVTDAEKYVLNMSLKQIKEKIKGNFSYSHKSCIVNKDYIKEINKKSKEIKFLNNATIMFLSKKFVMEVK